MTPRTLVNPNMTPKELWPYKQYVCWQFVDRGKPKLDKVPINARTLKNAGSTWPNTWCDIRTAVTTYKANDWLAGIGFVLSQHDPYVMIDLDRCLIDGNLSPFASEIVEHLNTYTEFSPSLTGLRLFVHCPEQPEAIKRDEIEIYSKERFATLTGNVFMEQRPIARIASLKWLTDRFANQAKGAQGEKTHSFLSQGATASQDDQELWQRIFAVNSLAKDLYNGNMTVVNGQDPSRAVILLLNSLAKWTKGDAARMRQMMEQTSLDKSKWKEKRKGQDWLTGRIQDAINYMGGR